MSGSRGLVLIVEDDLVTGELLTDVISEEGFQVVRAGGGEEAVETFAKLHPAAVLLDWVLPDIPGIEACRRLRALDRLVPIIFLSGRDDEASVIRGLDAGADDYVVKPARIRELASRLEAHLRKTASVRDAGATVPADLPVLRFGEIEVDLGARRVLIAGKPVGLPRLEMALLEYLARNAGTAVSREQILGSVYGYSGEISTERVDQLARRLRSKLGAGPERGGRLVAVPGYGYRLEPSPAPDR